MENQITKGSGIEGGTGEAGEERKPIVGLFEQPEAVGISGGDARYSFGDIGSVVGNRMPRAVGQPPLQFGNIMPTAA